MSDLWRLPSLYFVVTFLLLSSLGFLAIVPTLGERLRRSVAASTTAFLAVVALVLVVGRMTSLGFDAALNPDEAQVIAQAMNLAQHAVPWRSYDPNTAGPLDSAILALTDLVGQQPSYFSTRLIAAALLLATLFALFWILRRAYGELTGRLAILPATAFFALAARPDYLEYSTELLPVCLTALATAIGLSALGPGAKSPVRKLFLSGILLGASPFGKLQAAPLAFYIAIALLVAIVATVRGRTAFLACAALAVGMILVPIEVLAPVAAAGALGDFAISYVAFPYLYYSRENCCHPIGPAYFFQDGFVGAFVAASILVVVVAGFLAALRAIAKSSARVDAEQRWLPIFFAGLSLVALYVINRPQTGLSHYLFFLVFPLGGLSGSLFGLAFVALRGIELRGSARFAPVALAVVVAAIALGPPLLNRAGKDGQGLVGMAPDPTQAQIAEMLKRHVAPGERMAIWGWMPQYFVATGAVPGTRDTITEFQIEPRHYLQYYRDRYVADMQENQPQFFLDAVAPDSFAYKDRAKEGYETFPALDTLVDESYHLVDTVDGVRLYQRNS